MVGWPVEKMASLLNHSSAKAELRLVALSGDGVVHHLLNHSSAKAELRLFARGQLGENAKLLNHSSAKAELRRDPAP